MTRKNQLILGPELALPLDTVTSTIIVYGGKGMGKTILGSVLAEELSAAGLRWAWLDPLGVGYGLRFDASGGGKGIECLILGGAHGDIPITPDAGAAVADIVVDETVNVLIDFSRKPSGEMWGVGEKIRFAAAYARRLFQRQGGLVDGKRREPLMQFLDEGARYIPQTVPAGNPGLSESVSAWQQFVEEGRNVGLGLCVLTQRSARINKDVAELADAMFAFRTVGPNSLGAVLDWLGDHVEKGKLKILSDEVRKLPRGSALVVSPGWLEVERVVAIRMRSTFDSSATPKPGEKVRRAHGEGAKPNLDRIREKMAATITRAKLEDPKELKALVVRLEKEIAALKAQRALQVSKVERITVPMFDKEAFEALRREVADQIVLANGNVKGALHVYMSKCLQSNDVKLGAVVGRPSKKSSAIALTQEMFDAQEAAFATQKAAKANGVSEVGGGLRRIMIALAQRPGLTNRQIGVRAGLSSKSGTFSTYLSRGKTNGWIAYDGSKRSLTQEGEALVRGYEPLPSGTALLAHWLNEVGGGAARILRALADAYPRALSNEEIGEAADISHASGTFSTYMSRLRTLELIEGGRGATKLSEELVG